jgi:hypothetical protein
MPYHYKVETDSENAADAMSEILEITGGSLVSEKEFCCQKILDDTNINEIIQAVRHTQAIIINKIERTGKPQ